MRLENIFLSLSSDAFVAGAVLLCASVERPMCLLWKLLLAMVVL